MLRPFISGVCFSALTRCVEVLDVVFHPPNHLEHFNLKDFPVRAPFGGIPVGRSEHIGYMGGGNPESCCGANDPFTGVSRPAEVAFLVVQDMGVIPRQLVPHVAQLWPGTGRLSVLLDY